MKKVILATIAAFAAVVVINVVGARADEIGEAMPTPSAEPIEVTVEDEVSLEEPIPSAEPIEVTVEDEVSLEEPIPSAEPIEVLVEDEVSLEEPIPSAEPFAQTQTPTAWYGWVWDEEPTPTPEVVEVPEPTPTPEVVEVPEPTPTPEVVEVPEPTPTPEVVEEPEPVTLAARRQPVEDVEVLGARRNMDLAVLGKRRQPKTGEGEEVALWLLGEVLASLIAIAICANLFLRNSSVLTGQMAKKEKAAMPSSTKEETLTFVKKKGWITHPLPNPQQMEEIEFKRRI